MSAAAEAALVACLVLDPRLIDEAEPLAAEDFATSHARGAYSAIRAAPTGPVDPAVIAQHAGAEVGAWLFGEALHSVRSPARFRHWRDEVLSHARIRRARELCREFARCAAPTIDDVGRLAGELQQSDVPSDRVWSGHDIAADQQAALDAALAGVPPGLSTGLRQLDEITSGLQPGNLVVLAARPGVGKSALALQMALHAADRGHGVYLASLEMSARELGTRMVSMLTGINSRRIASGRLPPGDMEAVAAAHSRIAGLPMRVQDEAGLSVSRCRARVRALHHHAPLSLAIVDYLQLMSPSDSRTPREQQVSEVSRGLKGLASELNIPVLALSQLNRGVEHRDGKPRLSDLRESGAIEQDANQVWLLRRSDNDAVLDVAKNRSGPRMYTELIFHGARMRFEET